MTNRLYTDQLHYDQFKHIISLPRNTLIILCGPSGSGKSTFAANHFPLSSIVSTDNCRLLISDDVRNLESSEEAFDLSYIIVHKRMKFGRTTVFDSTALSSDYRKKLHDIALSHNYKTALIILQTSFQTCFNRDAERVWPAPVGKEVLKMQFTQFEETLRNTPKEVFDLVVTLPSDEVNKVQVRVS